MAEPKDAPSKQYSGNLDVLQAASAMQAARLNAVDLLDTSDILFNLKRFAHSLPFSILAIEESGKLVLLQGILLRLDEPAKLWRAYRSHRAKTETLNIGILSRIRTTFPEIPLKKAQELAANGPTPDDLERAKQRAVYSDCIDNSGEFLCHLPRNIDWRQEAWERLCEARAIVLAPRDRSPEELGVWVKHVAAARESGKPMAAILPDIHKELLERGFVEKGWWDTLLEDVDALTRDTR
jgi:AbiV family abortive infection protein